MKAFAISCQLWPDGKPARGTAPLLARIREFCQAELWLVTCLKRPRARRGDRIRNFDRKNRVRSFCRQNSIQPQLPSLQPLLGPARKKSRLTRKAAAFCE